MEHIVEITKSKRQGKKYAATVRSATGTRIVHFGSIDHQQYKDSALGIYSHKDHGDPKRRRSYFLRHSGVSTKTAALKKEKGKKITPKYLSHKYLW